MTEGPLAEVPIPEQSPSGEQAALDELWDKLVADGVVDADIQRPRIHE